MLHHAARSSARDEKFIYRESPIWKCDSAWSRQANIRSLNISRTIITHRCKRSWVSNVFQFQNINLSLYFANFPIFRNISALCGPIRWFESIADKQLVSTCDSQVARWLNRFVIGLNQLNLLAFSQNFCESSVCRRTSNHLNSNESNAASALSSSFEQFNLNYDHDSCWLKIHFWIANKFGNAKSIKLLLPSSGELIDNRIGFQSLASKTLLN